MGRCLFFLATDVLAKRRHSGDKAVTRNGGFKGKFRHLIHLDSLDSSPIAAPGDSMGSPTDVLVIGGGPAGLAAAIAARQKGFHVTVADGAKPPIDKACGEGLLPGTLAALQELGLNISTVDGRIFRRIRFLDGEISAEADFSAEYGMGVRRTVLHQTMAEHAETSGVQLLWHSLVMGMCRAGAIVGGKEIQTKWIIGADSIQSRVRRWSGLDAGSSRRVRFAQRRHYRVARWGDGVEVYWGRQLQVYVTPLGKEEVCVSVISRDPRMQFDEALREFPVLASSLTNAELSGVQRGTITAMCKLERVCRGNVALIGDASGSVDAVTGEGLGLSFRQALALADALDVRDLGKYQLAHRRLATRPHVMSRLLLLLDRYAAFRRRVLRGLAGDSDLFTRLLTAHMQETSPAFLAQ